MYRRKSNMKNQTAESNRTNEIVAEGFGLEISIPKADATAVCQTAQQLAGSMGTAILAAIIAVFQNKQTGSYATLTAQGSRIAFYFTFGLGILILVCDWFMFKLDKKTYKRRKCN